MILSIIVLLIIIYNIYRGYQSGLITEFVHIISYLIAFWAALHLAQPVGDLFQVVNHHGLVNCLAFIGIFIVVQVFLHSVGLFFAQIAKFPILHQLDRVGGAIFGGLIGYLLVFLSLSVALTLPINWLHQQYLQSSVSQVVINQTPGVTHNLMEQWLR